MQHQGGFAGLMEGLGPLLQNLFQQRDGMSGGGRAAQAGVSDMMPIQGGSGMPDQMSSGRRPEFIMSDDMGPMMRPVRTSQGVQNRPMMTQSGGMQGGMQSNPTPLSAGLDMAGTLAGSLFGRGGNRPQMQYGGVNPVTGRQVGMAGLQSAGPQGALAGFRSRMQDRGNMPSYGGGSSGLPPNFMQPYLDRVAALRAARNAPLMPDAATPSPQEDLNSVYHHTNTGGRGDDSDGDSGYGRGHGEAGTDTPGGGGYGSSMW